jgi:hypothetical protein
MAAAKGIVVSVGVVLQKAQAASSLRIAASTEVLDRI